MTWVLLVIMIGPQNYATQVDSMHDKMDKCFERRQEIVKIIGEPIVNYQAVCIRTDKIKKPGKPA